MAGTRKIAAILVTDVVGYSRLAGADEDRTLSRLRGLRSDLIDPAIDAHHGRIVKRTGDGSLIEFRSVVDAVRCAVEIQTAMIERNAGVPPERRIEFRVGIHLGDVVEEADGDLMGDGVNIAARLQGMAKPGAICLSEDAYRQVRARLDTQVADLGPQELKNIAEPIRVYSLEVGVLAQAKPPAPRAKPAAAEKPSARLALPNKPSIAVLPFQNMSGDPEQEYFADGMVEEITTALSRFRQFFVIARNSSFTYKGRAVDVKQVGRELGVRYVLEGSVRKAANRVRISGQLIDTTTGSHLWADRFDGAVEDIFDLQDQVTTSVVGVIAPTMERAEIERSKGKRTESLDAYDYYLRGIVSLYQWTEEETSRALGLFHKSIELDPDFSSAYGMTAWCYVWRKANGWMDDRVKEIAEANRLAQRAIDLGADDAVALLGGGYALVFVVHDVERGAAYIDRALALNPNLAWGLVCDGWTKAFLGEPDAAITQLSRAMRLSPLDPMSFRALGGIAFAHFIAGRYDAASFWAEKAMRERPNYLPATRDLAAAHALAGRLAEAQKAMAHLREVAPAMRVSGVKDWVPIRRPDDLARLENGLRIAGLPQ